MPSPRRRTYTFGTGLTLAVTGADAVLDHFTAEYGAPAQETAQADVEVSFVSKLRAGERRIATGGHKTVRWAVSIADAGTPMQAVAALGGRPRSFALSLVQGYFVEPLLGLAATRRDLVLLPAAAVHEADAATLLIGRSRSGKSTVCARALARGRAVLGDDHVLLSPDGTCFPFPRRMRVYPDLRETAPFAYDALPPAARRALVARRLLKTLTRGYVAPPVRLRPAHVRAATSSSAAPLGRIVLVKRDPKAADLTVVSGEPTSVAVEGAVDALAEQRAKLRAIDGEEWRALLAQTDERDPSLLAAAFADVPVESIVVPGAWPASRSIAALSERLGIG